MIMYFYQYILFSPQIAHSIKRESTQCKEILLTSTIYFISKRNCLVFHSHAYLANITCIKTKQNMLQKNTIMVILEENSLWYSFIRELQRTDTSVPCEMLQLILFVFFKSSLLSERRRSRSTSREHERRRRDRERSRSRDRERERRRSRSRSPHRRRSRCGHHFLFVFLFNNVKCDCLNTN